MRLNIEVVKRTKKTFKNNCNSAISFLNQRFVKMSMFEYFISCVQIYLVIHSNKCLSVSDFYELEIYFN